MRQILCTKHIDTMMHYLHFQHHECKKKKNETQKFPVLFLYKALETKILHIKSIDFTGLLKKTTTKIILLI